MIFGKDTGAVDVVTLGPAEFVKPLPESCKVGLPDFIVLGKAHDHADLRDFARVLRRPDTLQAGQPSADEPEMRAMVILRPASNLVLQRRL